MPLLSACISDSPAIPALANVAAMSEAKVDARTKAQREKDSSYFIRYKPVCPAGGEYKYTPSKQSWRCSICGGTVD